MSAINSQLEQHFLSHVNIDPQLKRDADRIYNYVKSEISNYIAKYKDNAVTMVDMGSSFDGLKVVAPNEYDVMLVVDNTDLKEKNSQVPGYNFLQTTALVQEAARRWRWIELSGCIKSGFLRPDLVRGSFQGMMQTIKSEHQDPRYTLHVRTSGPAIKVEVTWSGKAMTIDFVPAVRIRGEIFVARPLPHNVFSDVANRDSLWRKSYVDQEKARVSSFGGNLRKAVMMWKAAQLNSAQLQALSSYHFKTIGMMLARSTAGSNSLEDYVIAIGKELISALKNRNLPCPFDSGVNLLYTMDTTKVENVQNYVTRNKEGERLLRMLGA